MKSEKVQRKPEMETLGIYHGNYEQLWQSASG